MGIFGWIVLIAVVMAIAIWLQAKWEADEKERFGDAITPSEIARYGAPQPAFVCPHCQEKGKVLTKPIKKKAGISGAKATGAILTGGVSLLATGLSRKEAVTEAHCVNCNSTWHF